ncbi:hypothetical protein HID58_083188 [Brassica napus]|uniref:Uncharacterized protein n=1 Tax=Brassica napus TaxID=3708 RepID=A0ABQ7YEG3_BRANA|nr:hypothetical protein HID58_083188 [Brassica napus]
MARRRVPEPMKSHPRSLDMNRRKLQILLQLIYHSSSTSMDTEMLERKFEIRNIRFNLTVKKLLHNKSQEEENLLAYRNSHQLFRQGHTGSPRVVLFLIHATESLVVCSTVCPDHVRKPVLGPSLVPRLVGQQNRGASDAEQAVRNQHCFLVTEVPVLSNVLRGDNNRIHRDDPRAASHPAEVVASDVTPKLILIHDHRRQRRRRVKETTVHNQDPNILRLHVRVREQLIQRAEHDLLSFFSSGGHRDRGRDVVHSLGEVRVLSQTRPLEDLALELEGGLVEVSGECRVVHEARDGNLEAVRREVTGEVHQVNGPGPGHYVDDKDGGAGDDADEIVLEMDPELAEIFRVGLRRFDGDNDGEGEETESQEIRD